MINIDLENSRITIDNEQFPLNSPEAFRLISKAWLRCGWDTRYSYSFTWLGRPIIQLPEDLLRIQEVIFKVKPDVIIETGIAHGGSLIFYASLCKALGRGKVVGIDIEIKPHNRKAIEEHELSSYITLLEGSSIDPKIINQVQTLFHQDDKVLVLLDSCHTKEHVLKELESYSPFVTLGSYIVATDGVMKDFAHVVSHWIWDNPQAAAIEFVQSHPNFIIEEPGFLFNEGKIQERITYWPSGYIKRIQ